MSVTITDRDHGYKRLLVRAREFARGASVSVGVNSEPHEGSNLTNDELGAIHEFGLGTVPERSFLRGWVDGEQRSIVARLRGWVRGALFGALGRRQTLEAFGQYAVEGVRKRIRDHIPPPLDPETVRRKGGDDTPLIDTEQLIDAIEYEVKP